MEKTRFFRASTDRGVVVATIQVAPRNIRILRDCAGVAAALLIISIFFVLPAPRHAMAD